MTEKINKGSLAPSTFFVIITFYLIRSLLANPDPVCNPFMSSSKYFVSIVDILLVIVSGCWMCNRIYSASNNSERLNDPEEGEDKEENLIPEEGNHPIFH